MKKNFVLVIFLVVVTIPLALFMRWEGIGGEAETRFSTDMTLRQVAKANGFPLKELLYKLSHEDPKAWDLPRNKPIKGLDIDVAKIEHAIAHVKEEDQPVNDVIKFILWAIWISLMLLFVLSRKQIRKPRIVILILTVIVFGVLLGASPNPMESMVKLFKLFNKMQGDPKYVIIAFVLFTLFSLLGSKLICSWGCQLGAFQESIFNLPIFRRKYRFHLPFIISISIRLALFAVFVCLLFGILLGVKNFVIYHQVNYFKLFRPHDLAVVALYSLPVLVLASLFLYRPFCQLVCPFGLYAWLLENISLNKPKIIEDRCTKCLRCVRDCPTEAMKGIYEKKRQYFLPDCWSCGNCIEVCPTNAVQYGNHEPLPPEERTSEASTTAT